MSQVYDSRGIKKGTGGSSTDHGSLTGLGDDDHTQYLLTDGTRQMTGGLTITTTTGALTIPRMTTTERNLLTPANGMLIYNTTLAVHQRYEAGNWENYMSTADAFVTIGNSPGLSAERALTGTPSIIVNDNGGNSTVVLEVGTVDGGTY